MRAILAYPADTFANGADDHIIHGQLVPPQQARHRLQTAPQR